MIGKSLLGSGCRYSIRLLRLLYRITLWTGWRVLRESGHKSASYEGARKDLGRRNSGAHVKEQCGQHRCIDRKAVTSVSKVFCVRLSLVALERFAILLVSSK